MPEPLPNSVMSSPAVGRWLGFAVLVLAVPLVLTIAQVVADPAREVRAIPGGVAWAAVMVALLAGLAAGLLSAPGRAGWRRGGLLGGALAAAVTGGVVAYGVVVGPAAAIGGCAAPPAGGPGTVDGWARIDGSQVGSVSADPADASAIAAQLSRMAGAPFEDHGVERVWGVDARRCSVLVDGSQTLAAFPPLAALSGDVDRPLAELPVWRGELEWWTASDGRLVMSRVHVGGHPADAWGGSGLRGVIGGEFRLVRDEAAP